jgi:lysophospholipase L1-like esterase
MPLQVYSMALKAGANVLAIQLFPNRFVSQTSNNEKQRRLLNTMLRDYVSKQPARASCDQAKLLFLELPDAVFDFWSMPTGRIKQMQDDQLHLTPQGYDLLGGLVFDRISRETPLNACQCPSGSKSSAQLP